VDLAADARIRPVDDGPLGPTLSLEELAVDKLLALFGRAEARDFIDVASLVELFGLGRLRESASERDSGFPTTVLVDMPGQLPSVRAWRLRPAHRRCECVWLGVCHGCRSTFQTSSTRP
jgi:hypothetical protein